jgi:hypothetical protein
MIETFPTLSTAGSVAASSHERRRERSEREEREREAHATLLVA